jgi:hypothetical protein
MSDATSPKMPAFDISSVAESNFTIIPEPHRSINQKRYIRRLGDHAGLRNFGVNLTRIVPGGQSSYRHAHSRQDEFIFVLEGEVVLETDAGAQALRPGINSWVLWDRWQLADSAELGHHSPRDRCEPGKLLRSFAIAVHRVLPSFQA